MSAQSDLVAVQELWKFLDDAATTMTTRGQGHPVLAAERAPLRISILDIKRDTAEVVAEICHILGLFDQEDTAGIREGYVFDALGVLSDEIKRRSSTLSPLVEEAVQEALEPVLNRLRYLLGETQRSSSCLTCGSAVTADGQYLYCPKCGATGIPRYETCAAASEQLGATYHAVRKAVLRHRLVPLAGSWPPRYRFAELEALCRRSRPRQPSRGSSGPHSKERRSL